MNNQYFQSKIASLHSHEHEFVFNLPPLLHNFIVQGRLVVVINSLQRIPLYLSLQIHEHDDGTNKPSFKQESKPHLQIGSLHILGQ